MPRTYLRYALSDTFGLVAAPEGNVVYNDASGLVYTPALEQVLIYNLKRGVRVNALRQEDETSQVCCLALSPDKTLLAVGHMNGAIHVWKLPQLQHRCTFHGHGKAVTALAFNSEGNLLASGSRDTDIVVWDVIAEHGLFRLRGHRDEVTALTFGEDEASLFSASKDTFLKAWDLTMQHCVQTVVGHRSEVWSIAVRYGTDGLNRLVTGSSDNQLRVYEIWSAEDDSASRKRQANGAPVESKEEDTIASFGLRYMGSVFRLANDRVGHLQWSPDGRVLGVQSTGKVLELFEMRTPEEIKKRIVRRKRRSREKAKQKEKEQEEAASMKYFESSSLAKEAEEKAGEDEEEFRSGIVGEVDENKALAGDELNLFSILRSSHKIRSFSFLADRSAPATSDSPVMDILLGLHNNSMEVYKVSKSSKKLLASTVLHGDSEKHSGSVKLTSECTRSRAITIDGHRSDVRGVAVSSDDGLLMSVSSNELKLWNSKSKNCVRTMPCRFGLACAFAPGNRHGIVVCKDGYLQLFDLASGDLLEEHEAHEGAAWSVDIRPDGRGMVTGGADKLVKFWEFDLQKEDEELGSQGVLTLVHARTLKMTEDVLCVKYSKTKVPEKLLVAVATLDSTIKVFYEDTLKFFLSLYGHRLPVMAMDISDDNTLLISASADKNVKIWGLDFGDCHKSIFAHEDSIMAIRFMPRTHLFFTAGKDKMIKHWDADRFQLIHALEGHKGEIWSLACGSRGQFVVSASHDRSLRMWVRTEEQVFLEEEREREMEEMLESEVQATADLPAAGGIGTEDETTGVSGVRSTQAVDAAEKLQEALQVAKEAWDAWKEYEEDLASALQDLTPAERASRLRAEQAFREGEPNAKKPTPLVDVPVPNPRLQNQSPAMYMRTIPSAELEQAMLVLPFSDAIDMLRVSHHLLCRGVAVELCSKVALFLLRVHQRQIASTRALQPIITSLRDVMKRELRRLRDRIGVNIAGAKFNLAIAAEGKVMDDESDKTFGAGKNIGQVGHRRNVVLF